VYAADEIRAALSWTRRAADRELRFAEALVLGMPAVFTALDNGTICRSKAWLFAEMCAELTPEQTEVVCARLLPHAGGLTTGELAARIRKLALALDPEWAARRYKTAVRERNVVGYLDPDGTATVTGTGLPVEQAAAACARVEELARAAKQAGHPGRIGPLRTDIYLGLLDGRWHHMTREEIITDLLTTATPDTEEGTEPGHPAEPGRPGKSGPRGTRAPEKHTPPEEGPAPASGAGDAAPTGTAADPAPAASSDAPGRDAEDSEDAGGDGQETRTGEPATDHPSSAAPLARRVGVEVRVGLATLLGRDEHPGEVPGWGPVPAEVARTMVGAQRAASWRFAITDATGQLLLAGITRCRPHPASTSTRGELLPCRGGIVELQLPASLLTELATRPETCGAWAGVVTDLAAQYSRYTQQGWRGLEEQDPSARFAGAALRRHVQIRDRSCIHPGCRASAQSADLDHTRDHTLGGATSEENSGPLCRHDHQLKTVGGWRLHQSQPGHFTWRSPLNRIYHTQPPPITHDLPDPLPRPTEPDHDSTLTKRYERPIMEPPPSSRPDPPPPTPPDPNEPPPF
jgi:hypothetical protein